MYNVIAACPCFCPRTQYICISSESSETREKHNQCPLDSSSRKEYTFLLSPKPCHKKSVGRVLPEVDVKRCVI